jgi:hypothetical protein
VKYIIPIRKLVGTAAAFMIWPAPEAAFMLFLLWVWWDDLWPKALLAWDEIRVKKTRQALKADLSANVNPIHVCMMTTMNRAERERKARFRQRWRSRFSSWWRAVSTVLLTIDWHLKEADEWVRGLFPHGDPDLTLDD